jgi:hypothetical protein
MKRASWTEAFIENETARGAKEVPDVIHLSALDNALHDLWALGRNIILVWAANPRGIDVLVIPHYMIVEFAESNRDNRNGAPVIADSYRYVESLITGKKKVTQQELATISQQFGHTPTHIELPFQPGHDLSFRTIDSVIKRYSISLVRDRAVALFDAVEFSLYSPLEQVTQLNSLAYSVNAAYSKLLDKQINIRFARTTTGDGFYIWNRAAGIADAVDLYHFMHLVLADNAIAQIKSKANTVPLLRACFHVGPHYEFYQSEGLSPTTFSYIVGDVTIELARMIEHAKPGQILIGDFLVPFRSRANDTDTTIDTVQFIERAQKKLSSLEGLNLSGEGIDSLNSYLTGEPDADGHFSIKKYTITDKHGLTRNAFNAKLNIYRQEAEPIFLGLQNSDLSDFENLETKILSV